MNEIEEEPHQQQQAAVLSDGAAAAQESQHHDDHSNGDHQVYSRNWFIRDLQMEMRDKDINIYHIQEFRMVKTSTGVSAWVRMSRDVFSAAASINNTIKTVR